MAASQQPIPSDLAQVLVPFLKTQSDIKAHLRNNAVPSPSTKTSLSQMIQEGKLSLSHYVEQAKRLVADIEQLSTHIESAESIFAPIRVLPVEVLGTIFRIFVKDAGSSRLHAFDRQIQPNTLGAVCKHWREITLSMPSLWTHVSLEFSMDFPRSLHEESAQAIMTTILSRSCLEDRRLPLELTLYCESEGERDLDSSTEDGSRGLPAIIHSQLDRVHRLTLEALPRVLEDPALHRSLKGRLPSLQHLIVRDPGLDRGDDGLAEPCTLFEETPSLLSIGVCNSVDRFSLPMSQLSLVKCGVWGDYSTYRHLSFYSSFPEALAIVFHEQYPVHDPQYLTLQCRSLEFDVSDAELSQTASFPLQCPNLQHFKVFDRTSLDDPTYSAPHFNFSLDILHECIARSTNFQLRSLSIERVTMSLGSGRSTMGLVDVLTNLAALEDLTIIDVSDKINAVAMVDERLMEELTVYRDRSVKEKPLLPHLETVEFGVRPKYAHFSASAFVSMVRSRSQGNAVHFLKKVTIAWDDAENLAESLNFFKTAGLDVHAFKGDIRVV